MIKYIPIDAEDAIMMCRLQHEFMAYQGIIKRINTINLTDELKSVYKLKYLDSRLKRDIYSKYFINKYSLDNINKTITFKIDLSNNLLIYEE